MKKFITAAIFLLMINGCATGGKDLAFSEFYGYKSENFSVKNKSVYVTGLSNERTNQSRHRILRDLLILKLKMIGMNPTQKISSSTDYVAVFDSEIDSHGDGWEKYYFLEFYQVNNGIIDNREKVVDLTVKRFGLASDLVSEGEAAINQIFSEFPQKSVYNIRRK